MKFSTCITNLNNFTLIFRTMGTAFNIQSFFLLMGIACFNCMGLRKGLHETYYLLFQLKRDALSEVTESCKTKRRRTSASSDSANAEEGEELTTAPSSVQSLDLPERADSFLQHQLKVCSLQTCLVLKTQSVLHLLVPPVNKLTSPHQHRFQPHQHHHGRDKASVHPRTPKAAFHKVKCDNLTI